MTHVMGDIETLGTKAGCVILSVGAAPFNLDGSACAQTETFYRNIDVPTSKAVWGLISEPSTEEWWSKQSQQARDHLVPNQVSLIEALTDFSAYWKRIYGDQFWCQGLSFDVPILEHAYRVCGLSAPWKFWNTRDTRTVYEVCGLDPRSVPREGTYHNALDDSIFQIKCVHEAIKCKKNQ